MVMPLTMPPEEDRVNRAAQVRAMTKDHLRRKELSDYASREQSRLVAEGKMPESSATVPLRPHTMKMDDGPYPTRTWTPGSPPIAQGGHDSLSAPPGPASAPAGGSDMDEAIKQEAANQTNTAGVTGVAFDKAGEVPKTITRLPIPGGGSAFKNVQPEEGYGGAIYSDTSYGAREQGLDEAIQNYGRGAYGTGGRGLPAPPTQDFSTDISNIDQATGLSTGEAARLQQFRNERSALPAPSRPGSPSRPDYAEFRPQSIQQRKARMALNSLKEDMRRGRLTSKEVRAMMPAFIQQQSRLLGMKPGDMAKLLSDDNRTAQAAATAAGRDAAVLDQEAMRQAGETRRENLSQVGEVMRSRLPQPPKYSAVGLTSEDIRGNKTERPFVYNQSTGEGFYPGETSGQQGMRMVGTSNGRPVYEDAEGNRFVDDGEE